MFCPKCNKKLGVVWVSKPNEKNSLYGLDGVEYCLECHDLFVATPKKIEVQTLEDTKT